MNGYPTERPCEICGMIDKNRTEPRFGYVVCALHYDIKPAEIRRITMET